VQTLRTYGAGAGYRVEVVDAIPATVDADVSGLVVQHPNVYGVLEDVRGWVAAAHEAGARLIEVFDPMSLGVLAPPGDLGADIAVAEGQPLGNHLAFGGPYLGIIAARTADVHGCRDGSWGRRSTPGVAPAMS
jgi:glycine cleavage system P protein (glycine dehydrogenase) subunit 1